MIGLFQYQGGMQREASADSRAPVLDDCMHRTAEYRDLLTPSRTVPIGLGAMNFGEAWSGMLGECSKKTSVEILDYFFENGGNFIDAENNYQGEESEKWLGEWMESRQNRDQIVRATKFATTFPFGTVHFRSTYADNHPKSLRVSLEPSPKNLQTCYIDLLYIHWWDFTTSIPEIMQSLHYVVA